VKSSRVKPHIARHTALNSPSIASSAPGGICVSADIWGLVRATIGADFIDLGATLLKNIADPVHVFAISPDV
jgi:class 3 adenylate cyclase